MSKKAGMNGQFGWNIKRKNSLLGNTFLMSVLKLQDNCLWNQIGASVQGLGMGR